MLDGGGERSGNGGRRDGAYALEAAQTFFKASARAVDEVWYRYLQVRCEAFPCMHDKL